MSINEELSFTEYTLTEDTTDFIISFDRIGGSTDEVSILVNNTPIEDLVGYTVLQVNFSTWQVDPALPAGTVVRLARTTNLDKMVYVFTAGSKFIAKNVDDNFKQIQHSQQEIRDRQDKLEDDATALLLEINDVKIIAEQAAEDANEALGRVDEILNTGVVPAGMILTNSGQNQQQVNDFGGAKWYAKVGGYDLGAEVRLDNGDRVHSTIAGNTNNPNVDMTGWVNPKDTLIHIVNTLVNLSTLTGKDGDVVYVLENQRRYAYDSSLATAENGVTVIGKWEMEIQESYYASWFCADSSPAAPKQDEFMAGYIYATSKKRPFIVDIPIYVESTRKQSGFYNQVHYAVVAQSNSDLRFAQQGELIQIGVNEAAYSILSLYGADNFYIRKPKLRGDKYTKTGNTGESGFGLAITGCSNGIIEYPHVSECRGDGIYLGQEYYNNSAAQLIPKNIKVIKPTILDSYRNGLTLSAGEDVYFDAPFINIAKGTAPEACIDIEPEEGLANKSYLKNVVLHNATLLRGNSVGVLEWISGSRDVDVKFTGTTTISGCYTVIGCNGNAADWSTVSCNGNISFEKLVFDHRVTGLTSGQFDVAVPTRGKGIPIYIDNMEIHTDTPSAGYQVPFLFNGRYAYSGNFKVNSLSIIDHGSPTVVNMVRTSAGSTTLEHVKIPIPTNRKINHYDAVGTYICGDYVDVGGYEEQAVPTTEPLYLLANTQIFTPVANPSDGGAVYARVSSNPNIGRKLTYKLNANAVSIGYGLQVVTPFLEVLRIECTDKGGFVTVDNTQPQIGISNIFRKWSLGATIINQ